MKPNRFLLNWWDALVTKAFFFFNNNYELHENEQKEFKQDVEAAIGGFIEELKSGVNYMNRDSILEDLVYSEKTSEELYYLMRKEYSEM